MMGGKILRITRSPRRNIKESLFGTFFKVRWFVSRGLLKATASMCGGGNCQRIG